MLVFHAEPFKSGYIMNFSMVLVCLCGLCLYGWAYWLKWRSIWERGRCCCVCVWVGECSWACASCTPIRCDLCLCLCGCVSLNKGFKSLLCRSLLHAYFFETAALCPPVCFIKMEVQDSFGHLWKPTNDRFCWNIFVLHARMILTSTLIGKVCLFVCKFVLCL